LVFSTVNNINLLNIKNDPPLPKNPIKKNGIFTDLYINANTTYILANLDSKNIYLYKNLDPKSSLFE
jgi:hypothetical protein